MIINIQYLSKILPVCFCFCVWFFFFKEGIKHVLLIFFFIYFVVPDNVLQNSQLEMTNKQKKSTTLTTNQSKILLYNY